jgi:segregation and condensation protein A
MASSLTEEQVVKHLLFHKSLVSDAEDAEHVNNFLRIARERQEGSHVGIHDPFDRAIALAFDLVLEHNMDPWRINLMQFTSLYLARVRERADIDLISAGRLLLMAWTILRKQSDDLKLRAEPPPPPPPAEPENPWDSIPTEAWLYDDPGQAYTDHVLGADAAPIDEKVRHKGDRKVTFMELLEALEAARTEADLRAEITAKREAERAIRKARGEGAVEGQVHKDDQEQDIAEVWGRIASLNGHPIPITDIQEKTREDLVKTLVSVLFLARAQKIRLWQEDFPYGMIYVQNAAAAAAHEAAPIETTPMQASQN